jgi:hypothetical protein
MSKRIDNSKETEIEFSESDIEIWIQEDEEQVKPPSTQVSDTLIAEKYTKSQLRIVRETKDFNLDYLNLTFKSNSVFINVAPEYQRRQRWSKKKRSQLIESFLLNIPVPPIFLFETNYSEYEVVDGRQRIDTIRDFFSNNFVLTDLTYWPELNGKRFDQLPLVIQKGLSRRSLSAVILLAESRKPENDELDVRRALFERINTGGDKLTPQELRNALHPGPFNKMLIEIARSDQFTGIWGIPPRTTNEEEEVPDELANNTLYRNMADCELILRYFALKEAILENKKAPLLTLLDACMKNHTQDSDEKVGTLKTEYLNSLNDMRDIFDGRPFRIPGIRIRRPSRSLYDALMVARGIYGPIDVETNKYQIQERLGSIVANKETSEYDLIVGGKGNAFDYITARINLAKTILYG